MEAGYDYLLIRGRLHRRFFNFSGLFVIILGAILLASSGAYYVYAAAARGGLQELNAFGHAGPQPQTGLAAPVQTSNPADPVSDAGSFDSLGIDFLGIDFPDENGSKTNAAIPTAKVSTTSLTIPASAISNKRLYPGEAIIAGAWSYPASYEPLAYREEIQLQGFAPLAIGEVLPDQAPATRIIIPSIGLDSTVEELDIVDLAGSRYYETPVNTVGHIPESANGGEANSAWFFGHTESPISGEGSVFYNLTQIPGKLNNGEDVFIITENGQDRFLYRITSTKVVHQSELELFDTNEATIHLVSCVPRLVYDHRLVVSGELIARN
ncbi:MAG: sortase [Chloroflexi bacterium]|nr:sortase [Chloroflexota bacterium]